MFTLIPWENKDDYDEFGHCVVWRWAGAASELEDLYFLPSPFFPPPCWVPPTGYTNKHEFDTQWMYPTSSFLCFGGSPQLKYTARRVSCLSTQNQRETEGPDSSYLKPFVIFQLWTALGGQLIPLGTALFRTQALIPWQQILFCGYH